MGVSLTRFLTGSAMPQTLRFPKCNIHAEMRVLTDGIAWEPFEEKEDDEEVA